MICFNEFGSVALGNHVRHSPEMSSTDSGAVSAVEVLCDDAWSRSWHKFVMLRAVPKPHRNKL